MALNDELWNNIDNANEVDRLLRAGASPNCVVSSGNWAEWSFLTYAVYQGHYETVRLLLQRGVSPQQIIPNGNWKGWSLLAFCVRGESYDQALGGFSPTFRRTCKEMTKILLEHGAVSNQLMPEGDWQGWSLLAFAIYQGNLETIKNLLDKNATPNQSIPNGNWRGWPLLTFCVRAESYDQPFGGFSLAYRQTCKEMTRTLLKYNVDPNQFMPNGDWQGWSLLAFAVYKLNKETVEALLTKQATPNQTFINGEWRGWSLLAFCVRGESYDQPFGGYSVAQRQLCKEIARFLLEGGATADQQIPLGDYAGRTLIQFAQSKGNFYTLEHLQDSQLNSLVQPALIQPAPQGAINIGIRYAELHFERELGRGTFGVVYKGQYRGGDVAIKQLISQQMNGDVLHEFQNELTIMASLRSEYTVKLHGACFEPGHYSLVVEYMSRGSLYDLLHSASELSWSIRYQIALDLGYGMVDLHAQNPNIVHGDLKSLNVLVNANFRAKVADFGMSKLKTSTLGSTLLGPSAGGSIRWMAPEVLNGGVNSKFSDVYSYGRVLQEIITRLIPFELAINNNQVFVALALMQGQLEARLGPELENKNAPPRLAAAILWCCQFQSHARPRIEEVIEGLREEYQSQMTL